MVAAPVVARRELDGAEAVTMRKSPVLEMSGPPGRDAARRQRHVQEKRALTPSLIDQISWSADRLAEERRSRLRALLRLAKQRSAWHGERLRDVDPDVFEEDDIRLLPAMTKDDLMESFDRIVTDPQLTLERVEEHLSGLDSDPAYLLDRYNAIASGGSTGRRGVFVYSWDAWTVNYVGWFRYLLRSFEGDPFTMALVASGTATHVSSALLRTFADPQVIATSRVPVTLPLDTICAELNRLQPDVVFGYPTALRRLAEAAESGQLRIAPSVAVTGGEPLLAEIRAACDRAWGIPVQNWWLSSEGGPMAIGCGHGNGLHVSDDLVVIEPVDRSGRPVPVGVSSDKVYLTNLFNDALPLIRYEITDEVTRLDGMCPCGSAHRLIADVQGRLDDSFRYPGGVMVHPHVFRSPLGRERAIVEYQVRQTERGAAISLICTGDVDLARMNAAITEGLCALHLSAPEVTFDVVASLDRQETGKLRQFLPLPS